MHDIHERASLIGYVCFQYSYLDYLVSNIIWGVLNIDKEAGKIVTGSLDIRPRLDMAVELLKHYDTHHELKEFVNTMKNRIEGKNGIINKRNIVVHGVFSSREGDPKVLVESHRSKRHRERAEMTVDEIRELHDRLCEESKSLVNIMEAHGFNVH
ncbi:hypothetical protein [Halomonas aestuarii]|uniref:hypothetical protein n=1 Tax=Halomonas aestuarii TaxID=1897729 RepID=UPI000F79BA03|nr:hypothetical protein [Halomonas aestuarii]